MEYKLLTSLVINHHTRDVAGQQIWRELDSPLSALHSIGQSLGELSFSRARVVLQEEMAACKQAGQGLSDHAILAADRHFDI